MKFTVSRESFLKPLQLVLGVVERRQTLPILSNVLMVLDGKRLSLTGTDLEVEIVGHVDLEQAGESGEITVPARKLMDIVRSLPEGAEIKLSEKDSRAIVQSGRSRFTLSTLPASDFPNVDEGQGRLELNLAATELKYLIDSTAFAMAQQDVRYYLNGMLWEAEGSTLRAVATDGHRLAMSTRSLEADVSEKISAIIPRKGVMELSRLLAEGNEVTMVIGNNHVRIASDEFRFTSKLVDGSYPDYERVLPRGGTKEVIGDRAGLRQAFSRAAILSNEKYRGVRLMLSNDLLKIVANNPEQEEAEEEIGVNYTGEELEIGFNVSYLLDVLNVLPGDNTRFTLSDSNSSALVADPENEDSVYVVMPMRL
ncbi:MAG: DNA polymerase III subunit beta [Porticoccaceae bacterium]|nr:DNA polymerase III subunit beta [Porticoccaceae bacterium]